MDRYITGLPHYWNASLGRVPPGLNDRVRRTRWMLNAVSSAGYRLRSGVQWEVLEHDNGVLEFAFATAWPYLDYPFPIMRALSYEDLIIALLDLPEFEWDMILEIKN